MVCSRLAAVCCVFFLLTGCGDGGSGNDTYIPQDVPVADLGADAGENDTCIPSDVPIADQGSDDSGCTQDCDGKNCGDDGCGGSCGACENGGGTDTDTQLLEGFYYPPLTGDDWETVSPEQLGWNTAKLEEAIAYAGNNESTAFIILYRGRIVAERYWQEWGLHSKDTIASAAKSVTSILCGLAVQEGKLDISKTVTSYLGPKQWSKAPPEKEALITVRHLLSMTSGLGKFLFWQAEPGTIWYYNTPAYYVLADVIGSTTAMSLEAFSQQRLQSVIGMQDSTWVAKSFVSSARDMARFGLMVLGGGTWDGKTVITEAGYFAQSLESSQQLNPSYGYLWWLNGKSSYLLPGNPAEGGTGFLIPDAPSDLVAALGMGDKKIYVVKSLDLVVVRHGDATGIPQLALTSFDNILWQKLMAAIP